jgi:hypothetical protein
LDEFHILQIIWATSYLVKSITIHKEIFDFLVFQATNFSLDIKDDTSNPINRAINTIRGAAWDRILCSRIDDNYDIIIQSMNRAVKEEKTYCIKILLLYYIPNFIEFDEKFAFAIFSKLLKKEESLIDSVEFIETVRYLAYRNFKKMKFYFDKAEKRSQLYEQLGRIYSLLWLSGIEEVLNKILTFSKTNIDFIKGILDVAVHRENMLDSNHQNKLMTLFKLALSSKENTIADEYNSAFLRFEPEDFDRLLPYLISYSKSKVLMISSHYFCDYIVKSVNQTNSIKCIELIEEFPKIQPLNQFYDREPINAILAIYNNIDNSAINSRHRQTCIDIFDKMLVNPNYRTASLEAIELSEK